MPPTGHPELLKQHDGKSRSIPEGNTVDGEVEAVNEPAALLPPKQVH
jgi:hypothetical protein